MCRLRSKWCIDRLRISVLILLHIFIHIQSIPVHTAVLVQMDSQLEICKRRNFSIKELLIVTIGSARQSPFLLCYHPVDQTSTTILPGFHKLDIQ